MLTADKTLSIEELITHMQNKYPKLSLNSDKSTSYLTFINYDLLKAYLEATKNITIDLEQVVKHYDSDRKLKLLLWDGLERIEISARTTLLNVMYIVTNDEQWYCNYNNYNILHSVKTSNTNSLYSFESVCVKLVSYLKNNRKNLKAFLSTHHSITNFQGSHWTQYTDFILFCDKKAVKSINMVDLTIFNSYKRIYIIIQSNLLTASQEIQDFFNKIVNGIDKYKLLGFLISCLKLPFYIIVNELTFYEIELIIKSLSISHKQSLINTYSAHISGEDYAIHLGLLRKLRNNIAHHNPLCNLNLSNIANFSHFTKYDKNEIKTYCQLIIFYLDLIAPRNTLKNKIMELLKDYKDRYCIDFSLLGFSEPFEL